MIYFYFLGKKCLDISLLTSFYKENLNVSTNYTNIFLRKQIMKIDDSRFIYEDGFKKVFYRY